MHYLTAVPANVSNVHDVIGDVERKKERKTCNCQAAVKMATGKTKKWSVEVIFTYCEETDKRKCTVNQTTGKRNSLSDKNLEREIISS